MIKKILKIVGIVIVSIAIVAVLFIEFWPSLGGSVTDEDQKEYKARNSLYKKGIFHGNPEIQSLGKIVCFFYRVRLPAFCY